MTLEAQLDKDVAELLAVLPDEITEEAALGAIRAAYLRGYLEAVGTRPEAAV